MTNPGEITAHGGVADIFPVDSDLPVRIEVVEDRIAALRTYDPVNQRTFYELDRVEIGFASEPDATEGVTLLDHIGPSALVEEPRVAARRSGFHGLAKDAERFGRAARTTISSSRWNDEAKVWRVLDWSLDTADEVERFVERRAPILALWRKAQPVLDSDGKVVILGSARDLRFLRPRLKKHFGCEIVAITCWAEVATAPPGTVLALEAAADAGFATDDLLAVAAADLLGSRALTDNVDAPLSAVLDRVADLHVGDAVVHEEHGIARLVGIATMPGDNGSDAFALEFGDVGFGKTEIALRGAAIVAMPGGQVAIAAPTTVLVRQHLALFERRFEGSGIKVVGLSRLCKWGRSNFTLGPRAPMRWKRPTG